MTFEYKDVLMGLLRALRRAQRKAQPLISSPPLLDQEVGEDAMDVICTQFLAAGESLKRLDRMHPGLLESRYPPCRLEGRHGGSVMSSRISTLILMLSRFL